VSFAAIILCVASQRVFVVVVYFVIDSVQKLLDTPSHVFYLFTFVSASTDRSKRTTKNNVTVELESWCERIPLRIENCNC
jgi:hypothetical protein